MDLRSSSNRCAESHGDDSRRGAWRHPAPLLGEPFGGSAATLVMLYFLEKIVHIRGEPGFMTRFEYRISPVRHSQAGKELRRGASVKRELTVEVEIKLGPPFPAGALFCSRKAFSSPSGLPSFASWVMVLGALIEKRKSAGVSLAHLAQVEARWGR